MRATWLLGAVLLLAGCTGTPHLPEQAIRAVSQDSRVQYIVLHYTSSSLAESLATLSRGQVSSHYLLGEDGYVWQLVDDNARAWHAGESQWQGRTYLNASSIGIELVHLGYTDRADGSRQWHPYDPRQITALKTLLAELLKRHQLGPERVLGHSDIAPGRKVDPGPLFPWAELAESGLAQAPSEPAIAQATTALASQLPAADWFVEQLKALGYLPPWYALSADPEQTQLSKALSAFQLRYRPGNFSGEMDLASAALLAALATQRPLLQQ